MDGWTAFAILSGLAALGLIVLWSTGGGPPRGPHNKDRYLH